MFLAFETHLGGIFRDFLTEAFGLIFFVLHIALLFHN